MVQVKVRVKVQVKVQAGYVWRMWRRLQYQTSKIAVSKTRSFEGFEGLGRR
jgi:hypothetical protein